MIEKYSDLELSNKDKPEEVLKKLQDKINFSMDKVVRAFEEDIFLHAEELADKLVNIAPYGRYEDLIEDKENIINFLKTECNKTEVWDLKRVGQEENNIKLYFMANSIDQSDALRGVVYVDFSGNIMHAFCVSDV